MRTEDESSGGVQIEEEIGRMRGGRLRHTRSRSRCMICFVSKSVPQCCDTICLHYYRQYSYFLNPAASRLTLCRRLSGFHICSLPSRVVSFASFTSFVTSKESLLQATSELEWLKSQIAFLVSKSAMINWFPILSFFTITSLSPLAHDWADYSCQSTAIQRTG